MSIKDLKLFLEKKGVPCVDCIQKEDFVDVALSVKDQSDMEHSRTFYVHIDGYLTLSQELMKIRLF